MVPSSESRGFYLSTGITEVTSFIYMVNEHRKISNYYSEN